MVPAVLYMAAAGLGAVRSGVPVGIGTGDVHRPDAFFGIGQLVDRALSGVGQLCSDPEPEDSKAEQAVRKEAGGISGNGRR